MNFRGFQGSEVGNGVGRSPVPRETFTRSQLAAIPSIHRFIGTGGWWLAGWLAGWVAGWLAGLLDCWLAGWLLAAGWEDDDANDL